MSTNSEPTTTVPSASVFSGGYHTCSPGQVCASVMYEVMEMQLKSMDNYAKWQMSLWETNEDTGMSIMTESLLKECDATEKAGQAQADATRQEANKNIAAACTSGVDAAVSTDYVSGKLSGSADAEAAERNVANTAKARGQIKEVRDGLPDQPGEGANRRFGDEDQNPHLRGDDAQQRKNWQKFKSERWAENKDGLDTRVPEDPNGARYRDVAKTRSHEEVSEQLKDADKQFDTALNDRNRVEQGRTRVVQMCHALTQVAQQSSSAAFGYAAAEFQDEQAHQQAIATAARSGRETYEKMDGTDSQGAQGAASNASKTLDTLVRLAQAG